MNALPNEPLPELLDAHLVPAPARTLRDGLTWLGHVCPDDCPAAVLGLDALPAAVGFVRRGAHRRAGFAGLIVVDPRASGLPLASARELIAAVDACARREGIVVRIRSDADNGRAAKR